MASEAKLEKAAPLPAKKFRAACGAEMESSMREIRSHVTTCEGCKRAAAKK